MYTNPRVVCLRDKHAGKLYDFHEIRQTLITLIYMRAVCVWVYMCASVCVCACV